MNDRTDVPAFKVHRVTIGGLIPLARYYYCFLCDHDLTDWVMKQSPIASANCPNCKARIDGTDIARAQRDTKLGCLWTLVSILCFFLVLAALVGVLWVITGPQN